MSRLPRYFIPGYPLHVIQRGHNRQKIFLEQKDGRTYLHWLRDAAENNGMAIHAYVLMNNHVHFLVTPKTETSLPQTMKTVNQRYTPYINRRMGRTGTLWEGRYRSTVVESDTYFLAVSRYIELNPVRARITGEPGSYKWSSFKHNALGHTDTLITEHALYTQLGKNPQSRHSNYLSLFEDVLPQDMLTDIREATHKGWVLGSENFANHVEKVTGRQSRPKPKGLKKRGAL